MSANPLIAASTAEPTNPWAGVWIAEDIQLIGVGIRNGNWVDASLGAIGTSLDALAMVSDPVGSLLQYGVSWIIEHVRPLTEALDWLAGDPAQIALHAQTWRNVAGELRDEAESLARAVRLDVADWGGSAGPAYRAWAAEQQRAVAGLGHAADVMALATEAAGMLIAGVRLMVRDAIATCVSHLVVYAAEEIGTAGFATPLVVEQVTTTVAAWGAKITRWLRGLMASLRRLIPELRRLGDLIETLKQLLGRLRDRFPGKAAPGDVWVHGGHSTRPRNSDYERQERWARQAYEVIRQREDAERIAAHLRDAPRLDGTRGFSVGEIRQIRQHIFFEEHPLDDYAGGIVHERYEPSADMAEAWLRLRRGRPLPEDYVLLEHELAESRYYRDHPGATYRQAHRAANQVANWERRSPAPTGEDYADIGE